MSRNAPRSAVPAPVPGGLAWDLLYGFDAGRYVSAPGVPAGA